MSPRARLLAAVVLLLAPAASAAGQDAHGWPSSARTRTWPASARTSTWPANARTSAAPADPPAGVGLPEGVPVEPTLRPMTLPRLALRGDVAFVASAPAAMAIDPRDVAEVGLGAGVGLTDDVELSVTVLPLQLVPSVAYLNPSIAATFRLHHDATWQFALAAQVFAPVQSPLQASLAARLWVTLSPMFQLRTSVTYTGDVTTVGTTAYAHTASAEIDLVAAVKPVYFVLGTGVGVPMPATAFVEVLKRVAISLGAEVGLTVAGALRSPAADVFLSFAFPELFVPGGDPDKVLVQPWVFLAGARLFFTL